MIILGIDPGTRRTGFAILDFTERPKVLHAGVIRLSGSLPLQNRLFELNTALQDLYRRFQPAQTVVEKIFFGRNADSAFKLGHARGVCLMAAAENKSTLAEYAATYVKKAVTGSGAASKEHVRLIVTQVLHYTPESTDMDVSDALALALCHSQELQVQAKMSRQMKRGLAGSL